MLELFNRTFQSAQALAQQGDINQAAETYLRAVALLPEQVKANLRVGLALQALGRLDDALRLLARAVQLRPDLAETHNALGIALMRKGRSTEAIEAFVKVTQLRPDEPRGYNNLAGMLGLAGRTPEAIAALRKALVLQPDFAPAHQNLGNALKDLGDSDGAIASYDKAVALDPKYAAMAGNRLYALHLSPAYDAHAIGRAHRRWGEQQVAACRPPAPHDNDRFAERRLRIGYVSPDFRQHAVGWNLRSLLRCHDHRNFEIFCYASVSNPDDLTEQLQGFADCWRNVIQMTDDQLAAQVRRDGIDVLVDLTLHLDGNRLGAFARKPAPVQATYLGYCSTTGLSTIDYRFSDCELDPPGADLSCYSEETVRLPRTYWCYEPGGPTPEPTALPASAQDPITFSCLNNFSKVSDAALARWARILGKVSNSRLILHGPTMTRGDVPERIVRSGIPTARLEIVPRLSWSRYVEQFGRIDIALDPFPYAGGITTCDSLWMGVPVVTLRGGTAVGRSGASILTNVGLMELIADNEEDYERRAVSLAADLERLAGLRAGLRERMRASPLMDGVAFAKDVEAAYRRMWVKWCAEPRN